MATHSGTAGSVVVVSGGTTVVGEIREWSLNIEQNTPEVTAFGDSWREYKPGLRGASGSFQGFSDDTDATQVTLRAQIVGGSAPIGLRLYEGTAKYWSGSALISTHGPATSVDGVATTAFNFTGSGAWSFT